MQIQLKDMSYEELRVAAETIIRLWARTGIEEPTAHRVFCRVAEAITDEMGRVILEEFRK